MRVWLALALLLSATPAFAFSYDNSNDAPNRSLADYVKNYVDTPKGDVNWKTLGATKQIDIEGKTKDGYDFQYFKPDFPADVKALDGKVVQMKGFMFPLGTADKQTLFLFGPFPVNCPFHYHVGPNLVIEVHADKHPIKFSYDAVTVRGTLQLVPKDAQDSTFFRLTNAELVKS